MWLETFTTNTITSSCGFLGRLYSAWPKQHTSYHQWRGE
jgi:hypothetical protein